MQTEPTATEPWPSAFGGLIALATALGIGRFVYTPILPAMIAALSLGRSSAGLIASANFLGYLFGALLAALPDLPGSRRRWLIGCLAVSAVTTGGMGLATIPVALPGPSLPRRRRECRRSGLRDCGRSSSISPKRARPELSALHFAGVGVGIAASAVLVAALIAAAAHGDRCGWAVACCRSRGRSRRRC